MLKVRSGLVPLVALVFSAGAYAQSTGPDVAVSDLSDVAAYGQALGITAFAVGTTACGVGTQPVLWDASNNGHPVIAQNIYRYYRGRFEQVGQSWLKHGFVSTNSPGCGTCQQPPLGGGQLGVGCTDTYGAGLNGSNTGLGPRSQVNAATGVFPIPHGTPTGDPTIMARVQIHNSDLDPIAYSGARYFAEGHYVTADDAAAGNKNNNASWREIVAPAPGANGGVPFIGGTHAQQSAIYAWQTISPNVVLQTIDISGDGRVIVAAGAWPALGGMTHYEYAVYNMNSDRSVQGVTISLPVGAVLANVGFHDVDSHSGEPYSLTDWTPTILSNGVKWNTQTYAANTNANAIRWGTMYNFSFETTSAPTGNVTLDLFKPGVPTSASVTINVVPSTCPPAPPAVPPVSGGASYSSSSVAYDFVDISATGAAGPTGDDNSSVANLGFAFNFYGTSTTQLRVSTNGYLCLPAQNGGIFSNTNIPNGSAPNAMIAGYWDDLYAAQGGAGGGFVRTQTIGSAPNRRFIAEWVGIWHFGGTASSAETFEILLDEGTNNVTITQVSTNAVAGVGGGASATRGIEDSSGTSGVQVSLNGSPPVIAGTSVRLTPTFLPPVIPTSAILELLGTGQVGTTLFARTLSEPNKPVIFSVSLGAGPTVLPNNLGTLSLDLATLLPLADGFGVFGPANPAAVTNSCGAFSWQYLFVPGGLPPGLTLYFQSVIGSATAPNGSFHISNPVTWVTQ